MEIAKAYVEFGEHGLSKLRNDISGLRGLLSSVRSSFSLGNLIGGVAGGQLVAGGIRSLFSGIVGGIASVAKQAVGGAAQFESYNEQWRTLLGNMGEAQTMMNRLAKFADVTPFQLPEVVTAAQRLQVFGGAVLNTEENLRLMGDAASAVGTDLNEVAFWIAHAYSMMKEGQPFGRAALRLQELGLMSGKTRKEIEMMSELFPGDPRAFKILMDSFQPFAGGMQRMSETLLGKTSTLRDSWARVTREIGQAFLPTLKKAVDRTRELFDHISANKGIWTVAAENFGKMFGNILDRIASPEKLKKLADDFTAGLADIFKSKSITEAIGKSGYQLGKVLAGGFIEGWKEMVGDILHFLGENPNEAERRAADKANPFRKPKNQLGPAANAAQRAADDKAFAELAKREKWNLRDAAQNVIQNEIAKVKAMPRGRGEGPVAADKAAEEKSKREKEIDEARTNDAKLAVLRAREEKAMQEMENAEMLRQAGFAGGEDLAKGKEALLREASKKVRKREEEIARDIIGKAWDRAQPGFVDPKAQEEMLQGRRPQVIESIVKQRLAQWQQQQRGGPSFIGLEQMWKNIQQKTGETAEELLKMELKELIKANQIAEESKQLFDRIAAGGLLRFAN